MFKFTTKKDAQIADLKLDNSILRQQLNVYGRTIDAQADTIKRLQQRIKFYEMINNIDIDFPNSEEV